MKKTAEMLQRQQAIANFHLNPEAQPFEFRPNPAMRRFRLNSLTDSSEERELRFECLMNSTMYDAEWERNSSSEDSYNYSSHSSLDTREINLDRIQYRRFQSFIYNNSNSISDHERERKENARPRYFSTFQPKALEAEISPILNESKGSADTYDRTSEIDMQSTYSDEEIAYFISIGN
jgi:hypothetical protein